MLRKITCVAFASLLASFAIGCASPLTKARKDNRQLAAQLEQLQNERRVAERQLLDMEKRLTLLAAKQSQSQVVVAPSQSGESLPNLAVTVLAPKGRTAEPQSPVGVETTDDEWISPGELSDAEIADFERRKREPEQAPQQIQAPRRIIVTDDGPAVVRRRSDLQARIRVPLRPATATKAPDRSGSATDSYRAAVASLKAGNHAEAITGLRSFIASNPNHDYADNAQYWLGEAYYDQKEYETALSEFRTTIATYPQGNKVPDAMLKVGYCYYAMGQSEKAIAVLSELTRLYPKSEPASLAAKRMEQP